MSDRSERMKVASDALLDASLRVHAKEIVEYVLRGNGRRIVPKAIYLAAWEIQYALNRTSNVKFSGDAPLHGAASAGTQG